MAKIKYCCLSLSMQPLASRIQGKASKKLNCFKSDLSRSRKDSVKRAKRQLKMQVLALTPSRLRLASRQQVAIKFNSRGHTAAPKRTQPHNTFHFQPEHVVFPPQCAAPMAEIDGAIATGRRRRTTVTIAIAGQNLIAASESGDVTKCAELLDSGAYPSWADAAGSTPLHAAAEHGRAGVFCLSDGLRSRPLTTQQEPRPLTPLCSAVKFGSAAVVSLLLDAGANHANVSDELISFVRACARRWRRGRAI